MSFDKLDNYGNKKINLPVFILFTFLALFVSIFLPFIGFIGLAVLPIPATLLILTNRVRDGIICAILGVGLLFFFNYALAIFAIFIVIGISFIYKYYLDRDKKALFYIGSIFSIFCGAVILYIIVLSVLMRSNFVKEFLNSYNNYVDNLAEDPFIKRYIGSVFAGGTGYEHILRQTQNILRFIPYLFPAILGILFSVTSMANYSLSCILFKKYGISLKPLPDFKSWDIPWYYCWGFIIGLIFIIVSRFNQNIGFTANVIGINLVIFFGFIYTVLGISVLWEVFDRFKVSILWRMVIFIFLGLFIGFTVLLPVAGLLDIWFNFRKLKRR